MTALQQFLAPQVLTRVISQVAATSDWLATLFGVQPGGKNVLNMGHGREGAYHIYNHVRRVGQGRAPGTAAARRAPQNIGKVQFTYPRLHDSVPLQAEVLHNLGLIADPARRDTAGKDMIKRQTTTLGELAANWRKAMLIGMLRDQLFVNVDGDNEFFQFTDPGVSGFRVNFQMPAGNRNQLNMLGAGNIVSSTWASDATDIPLQLGNINAAFQSLNGGHLGAIICPWAVWNWVVRNPFVRALHGSSNQPFVSLESDQEPTLAKTMKNVHRAKLNTLPNTVWYITDEIIEVGPLGAEVQAKIVPDNTALFIGFEPGDDVIGCYEGSEPIAEYDGGPIDVKTGLASWSVSRANPTSTDLFVLDNALVANHIPNSIAHGTVVF